MTEGFFDLLPNWQEHWNGMPAFNAVNAPPYQTILVHLRSPEARDVFSKLIGQRIARTKETKTVWYPAKPQRKLKGRQFFTTDELMLPRYPVYIISKGRWESRLTSKAFEEMGVPYRIVVEPQEYDNYAAVIDPNKILVLPFSNLRQGSIPARNWVWEDAVKRGSSRHWIFDDNIRNFWRLFNSRRYPVVCPNMFPAAEDFVDRYENVALAGFQYVMFVKDNCVNPAFILNTQIYSNILIRNDLPFRWRGRYNEDTDLSLRVLKQGCCTVLFSAFLAQKIGTLTMKGGNTDELYQREGRLEMAKSLQEQHPDVVKVTRKWGRWQHQVDYSRFKKNKLQLKAHSVSVFDTEVAKRHSEYGMYLKIIEEEEEKDEDT